VLIIPWSAVQVRAGPPYKTRLTSLRCWPFLLPLPFGKLIMSDKDELLKSIKAKKKEIAKANQSSQGITGNAPVPQGSKLQMQAMQAELKALRGQLKALGK